MWYFYFKSIKKDKHKNLITIYVFTSTYLFNKSLLNITFSLYFWSNKCSLDEHMKLISKTLKIVMGPNVWPILYVRIHQKVIYFLFEEDEIVVMILLYLI